MAELKAKVGESRMDLIRRAKPGDTLIFGNECLERKNHCFDDGRSHTCFNCCYCNLPNGTDRQFQEEVAEEFKRVHGNKFKIIPVKNIEDEMVDLVDVLLEWAAEDLEERRPILDSIYAVAVKKVKYRDFKRLLGKLA